MRKILTPLLLLLPFYVSSQVFVGPNGAISNDGQNTIYNLTVTGLSPTLSSSFGLQQVSIDINHTNVSDLYIYIQSPAGTLVLLSAGSSITGSHFTGTTINNVATSSIL